MLRINVKIVRFRIQCALWVGAPAALLSGCPLYQDDCDSRSDCASGFSCDQFSRHCEPILEAAGCRRPDQCAAGETCTPDFACLPGSCQFHGCVTGYECGVVDSAHACVLAGTSLMPDAAVVDASSPPGTGGSGGDAGSIDAGPGDAGDASADASL